MEELRIHGVQEGDDFRVEIQRGSWIGSSVPPYSPSSLPLILLPSFLPSFLLPTFLHAHHPLSILPSVLPLALLPSFLLPTSLHPSHPPSVLPSFLPAYLTNSLAYFCFALCLGFRSETNRIRRSRCLRTHKGAPLSRFFCQRRSIHSPNAM